MILARWPDIAAGLQAAVSPPAEWSGVECSYPLGFQRELASRLAPERSIPGAESGSDWAGL
jgi:hypothetical protein